MKFFYTIYKSPHVYNIKNVFYLYWYTRFYGRLNVMKKNSIYI